jgi:hypothetical protein
LPTVPGLIPDVNPQAPNIPNVGVDAPVAAFGGSVGLALEKLGATVEQSSDKIWQRAVQLQEMQNKTEHDNAEAEFIKQSAAKNAEFNTKQGVNAGPRALTQHIQDINDIREQIGSTLTNPRVAQMYNNTSKETTARYVVNATNHSVSEGRSAYTQGLALKEGVHWQEWVDDPTPATKDRATAASRLRARDKGLAGDAIELYVKNAKAAAALQLLDRHATDAPEKVDRDLEEFEADGTLAGKELTEAKKQANSTAYTVMALKIADDIYRTGVSEGQQKKTLAQVEEEADSRAESYRPDDIQFKQKLRAAAASRFHQGVQAEKQQIWTDRQTIADLQMAGADTPEKIKASPEGAEAWERIPKTLKKTLTDTMVKVTKQASTAQTKAFQEDNLVTLKGMATSNDADIRSEFLDRDLMSEYKDGKLSAAGWSTLNNMRKNVVKGQNTYDHINTIMSQMRNSDYGAKLSALRLDKPDPKSPEEYYHFIGQLYDSVEYFKQTHDNRLPNSTEVHDVIFPQLIQTRVNDHWYGTRTETTRTIVPEKFSKTIKDAAKAAGQPAPEDWELQNAYSLMTMKDLYGSGAGRKTDLSK